MAAIAYWCVTRHVPALEQKILSNAQAALTSANAGEIDLSVEGRTATLAGAVTNDVQKNQLLNVVAEADGVSQVNDQLTIVGQPATEPENTEVASEQTENTIEADAVDTEVTAINESDEVARVPDSAGSNDEPSSDQDIEVAELFVEPEVPVLQESEITETTQIVEPDPVETQNSEPVATPDIDSVEARALALIEQAKQETADSLIDPDTPRPDNTAALDQELTTVTEAQRTVAITEQPTLTMKVEQGTLTLTGDISDQDNLLTLIRSAMGTFDASYVVNSVQVHDYTAKADWLPALNRFLPSMKAISNAGVDIIESQITLSGEALNDKQHDDVIDTALVELSELSLVERISIKEEAIDTTTQTNNAASTSEQSEVTQSDSAQTVATTDNTETSTPTDANAQNQALKGTFESLDTGNILFESGSDVLTEESLAVIETMAALFAEHPSVNIEIDGHTDASGDSTENLKLSQLRANAVRDYLVQQGIAANRLSAYGFGDGVPIADNSTPAGRRLNRRIEFNF